MALLRSCEPGGGDPGLGRNSQRHAVQPAADRLAATDRVGPTCQDQECRLRRVLGIVLVAQHLPADPQDHRPMAIDQRREGRFRRLVPLLCEPFEQLAVGQTAGRTCPEQCLDLPVKSHRWIRGKEVSEGVRQV